MSGILVVSELWHPNGGGAELATYLYTRKLLEAGHKVTIATTGHVSPIFDNTSSTFVPLGIQSAKKSSIILRSRLIKRKIRTLAAQSETVYIPGKMIFLVPFLKKINPSLRIIVHLHDYQMVCPHASLYDFTKQRTCDYIWSDLKCARCTRIYESAEHGGALSSLLGSMVTLGWRQLMKTSEIQKYIECVDLFVTVSTAQAELIMNNLGEFSSKFKSKNLTIYNPVDTSLDYVSPQFDGKQEICIGFLGGDRYMKGFDIASDTIKEMSGSQLRLLATKTSRVLVENNIELLCSLSKDEMSSLFKRIWIVLFTSRWNEPLPYAVVESQLRGRPVVGADVGGVREAIAKIGFTGDVVGIGVPYDQSIRKYMQLIMNNQGYTREVRDVAESFFAERTRNAYENFSKVFA